MFISLIETRMCLRWKKEMLPWRPMHLVKGVPFIWRDYHSVRKTQDYYCEPFTGRLHVRKTFINGIQQIFKQNVRHFLKREHLSSLIIRMMNNIHMFIKQMVQRWTSLLNQWAISG